MSSGRGPIYTVPASRRFSLSHRIDIVHGKLPCLWAARSVDLCWVRISLMHLSAFREGLIGGVGVQACKCVRVCTHKHPRVQKPSILLITSNALMPDYLSEMFYPWGCASLRARKHALNSDMFSLGPCRRLLHAISLLLPGYPCRWECWGWAELSRNCVTEHVLFCSPTNPHRCHPFFMALMGKGRSAQWCSRSTDEGRMRLCLSLEESQHLIKTYNTSNL